MIINPVRIADIEVSMQLASGNFNCDLTRNSGIAMSPNNLETVVNV